MPDNPAPVNQTPKHSFSDIRAIIPDTFSGDRREFYEFLQNCENAYRLCTGDQKQLILVYIVSRLKGSARAQIQEKEFNTWDELKTVLTDAFSDKRDLTQLMEDLHSTRQGKSESVHSFFTKLEQIQTRILNAISLKHSGDAYLQGRLNSVRDMSLQRFILHSNEEISMALRRSKPRTLADALSEALLEEKYLQARKSFSQNHLKTCNHCKKTGHLYKDCRLRIRQTSDHNISFNKGDTSSTNKNCNYCKKSGHLISECRKRQYNNQKRKNQNRDSQSSNSTTQEVHLNSSQSQVDVVPVDSL